ncbi:unnamed protein product [Calicophoron daubneyi]|uniref:Uncharacterized protein n=1 Tax=Calicophoron daubneyi TaxID=300641 RepID=A0AAV2T9P3_CALDB
MAVGMQIILVFTTAIGFIFGILPLTGTPRATDSNLPATELAYLSFEIMGVIIMIIAFILVLASFGERGFRGLRVAILVLSAISMVFFMIAIGCYFQFNPRSEIQVLPGLSWIMGAMMCGYCAVLESVDLCVSH